MAYLVVNPRAEALKRHATQRRGQLGLDRQTSVTVVTGPPCSGKTTYVNGHAQPGDLIVDWDVLAVALTGTRRPTGDLSRFVADARDAVLAKAATGTIDVDVWVVTTEQGDRLSALASRLGAKVHTMDTDMETCLTRLREDPDGRDVAYATDGIHRWFTS